MTDDGSKKRIYGNAALVLQKRALRLILNYQLRHSSRDSFAKLDILPVFDIYRYQVGIFHTVFPYQ